MSLEQNKLKLGFINPISIEWFNLHSNKIEITKNILDADYIIFESNGDPVHIIENIKYSIPKNKLVLILSGDQNGHIDDTCIWFANAVKPSGLAAKQTQIFVTNPAIFKYYEDNKKNIIYNDRTSLLRSTDIYFKGTIWEGMRTDMYKTFSNKLCCKIISNNNYWNWRCNSYNKPSQKDIEDTAFESYNDIMKSKLCLCPKGNGNSSMRIIEALACGAIPVLINDFSAPFGKPWGIVGKIDNVDNVDNVDNEDEFCLVFDTNKYTWEKIHYECMKLINDTKRFDKMQNNGKEYFEKVIYSDSLLPGFQMYKNIDTVCFGFSNLIIDKLISMKQIKN